MRITQAVYKLKTTKKKKGANLQALEVKLMLNFFLNLLYIYIYILFLPFPLNGFSFMPLGLCLFCINYYTHHIIELNNNLKLQIWIWKLWLQVTNSVKKWSVRAYIQQVLSHHNWHPTSIHKLNLFLRKSSIKVNFFFLDFYFLSF